MVQTDALPSVRGRLVITSLRGGPFRCQLVRGSKWGNGSERCRVTGAIRDVALQRPAILTGD